MEPDEQGPSVLGGLPLSGIVREALDNAAERCEPDRPLQTGMVLAALIEADAHGDWDRVWPSHDGTAEPLLVSDDDANALASDENWQQADLSEDLLAALDLLTATARRYAMDPVQPGALALALASIPGGSASRHMSRLSGYPTAELIDHIQSDLLGTVLEGFSDAVLPEETPARPGALLRIAGLLTAAACVFGAWQALRLFAGPLIGAVLAVIVFPPLLSAVRESRGTREPAARGTAVIGPWSPANYLHPLKLFSVLLMVFFLVFVLTTRHRFSSFFPILVTVAVFFLFAVVLVTGFNSEVRRPGGSRRKSRYSWFPAGKRYHRLPVTSAIIVGLVLTFVAIFLQFNYKHYSVSPSSLIIDRWLAAALFDSGLAGWFPFWYWSMLVGLAAAAGGYLLGAAVWAASKVRHVTTTPSWRWHAVSACLIGTAVTVLGNLPQSPLNYPAIKASYVVPHKFPAYPDAITINDTISFTALHWTYASPTKALATGYVQISAAGTLQGIPVDVAFVEPRQCRIENSYVHVTADVFTQVQIMPLFDDFPRGVAERYTIATGCA